MDEKQKRELLEISGWLETLGKNRDWLANELGVSIATVNGWYSLASGRPIPRPTYRLIQVLMRNVQLGEPLFTYLESKRVTKAMEVSDCVSFSDFARDAICSKVDLILNASVETQPALRRVADQPSELSGWEIKPE